MLLFKFMYFEFLYFHSYERKFTTTIFMHNNQA